MDKIGEKFYFIVHNVGDNKETFTYCRLDEDHKGTDGKPFPWMTDLLWIWESPYDLKPIIFYDDYALSFKNPAKKYDHKTQETSYILWSKEYDQHILFGDYLYRKNNDGWYRANISEGLDNPQWELVIFSEA